MQNAIEALQKAIDAEPDDRKKSELRRAIEALKRGENATDLESRQDYRDKDFKQVANEPENGEELANAVARTNRMDGDLPETVKPPASPVKTPPPIEAGKIAVDVDKEDGRRTVNVKDDTGQPSKPADVPAHSDKKADEDKK